MRVSVFIFFFAVLVIPDSFGNDGPLPRGKGSGPGVKQTKQEKPKKNKDFRCLDYLANPETGSIYNSKDFSYLIANRADKSGSRTSFLLKVDPVKAKAKRILKLNTNYISGILGHGQPVTGISVLGFKDVNSDCGTGIAAAAGFNIPVKKNKKISKSLRKSKYKIFRSNKGLAVADLSKRYILAIDSFSFQRSIISRFPEKVLPIFFNFSTKQLYALKESNKGIIHRYDRFSKKPAAKLILNKNFKVIQQEDNFAILDTSSKEKIKILRPSGWSKAPNKSYTVNLPKGIDPKKIGVNLDFDSMIAIVQGSNREERRRVREILVIDVANNNVLERYSPTKGLFVDKVSSPIKGRFVTTVNEIFEPSLHSIRVYNIKRREWETVVVR